MYMTLYSVERSKPKEDMSSDLQQLLPTFEDIFGVLTEHPSQRSHDH